MSRSRKKPYGTVCHTREGEMKQWKSQANQLIRRMPIEEDLPRGNLYRRISDVWNSPSDGKMCYGDDDKWTRK